VHSGEWGKGRKGVTALLLGEAVQWGGKEWMRWDRTFCHLFNATLTTGFIRMRN